MVAIDRKDDAAFNRNLRRADWRFLLPNPRPGRAICFTNGLLARAVAAISDHMIGPMSQPVGDCDLAVAQNPERQTLQAAWEALRPGGACYMEWTSPLSGGPIKLRQLLESAGFTEAVCYWPWPWPDRSSALYWVPVESPHIVQYFLANRIAGKVLLSRVWNKVLEVVWRIGLYLGLLAPLSIVARKPPVAEDAVLDVIRSGWSSWDSGPPPQRLDWMLLAGGAKPINKIVGLVFAEYDLCPRLIVKLARANGLAEALDREAANLRALRVLRPDLIDGVPQLLFSHEWAGQTVLGESALAGRPLYTVLQRETARDLAIKMTEWLVDLAGQPPACPRFEWWDRLIGKTAAEFERNFGQVLDPAKLQTMHTVLASLGDLPLVYEHRDFSPWNVLIDRNSEPVILDWESAEPRGLPALDLVYFLTYLAFFLDGAMDSRRFRDSYRAALDPATFTGSIVADCQQRYLARLGLDPDVLRPLRLLTWLVHSKSEYRQMAAGGAGQPSPSELRSSLFVSLWEEELSHEARD